MIPDDSRSFQIIPDVPSFGAFLRLKLLQKEHFLNFQKSVLFEAVLNGEKLQKMARLEWSGMVWNDLESSGMISDVPNMSFAASCVSAFFYAFFRSKLF